MAIANYSKVCAKNTPGNQDLFFTEVANISSVTISSGEITAVTMEATETFHQFKAEIDTIKMNFEGTGTSSYFQNNKIEALFAKLTKELVTAKTSLVDAVICGAVAIVLDGNSQAWLVGWNDSELGRRPLNKITANFDSGAKPSDEGTGAYTITLEGETGYDAVPFDTATNGTIVDGSATFITWN